MYYEWFKAPTFLDHFPFIGFDLKGFGMFWLSPLFILLFFTYKSFSRGVYNNIKIITDDFNEQQMLDLYYEHDVLIYPTYGEGFGFIPLQALATGMPTICTYEWADYKNLLGPLALKSEYIDSPWPFPHEGKVLEPNRKHLVELMKDVAQNFNAYSGYYYAQANKVHQEYNWLQLTNKSFNHIFKKFS
jgi:glycosyltransferase involved in cell wall biosynthesis